MKYCNIDVLFKMSITTRFHKFFKDVKLVSQTSLMALVSTSYFKLGSHEFINESNNNSYAIIFARPDEFDNWFEYIPKDTPFVICLGLSDRSVEKNMFDKLCELKNFKGMLAQNITFTHPKAIPMPIGFKCGNVRHYQNLIRNPMAMGNGALAQQKLINKIYLEAPKQRIMLCYINFVASVNTNPSERGCALKRLPNKLCFFEKGKVSIKETYENQSKYAFVVSPHGNGLDCYRTWEAIHLGCIPIVKKDTLSDAGLYDDLPVLIVDDWADINENLLNNAYKKLHIMFSQKLHKLTIEYWREQAMNLIN